MTLKEKEWLIPRDINESLKAFRNDMLDFAHLSLPNDKNKTFRNLTMNKYNDCKNSIMKVLVDIGLIEVCPSCKDTVDLNCNNCHGVGFITRVL